MIICSCCTKGMAWRAHLKPDHQLSDVQQPQQMEDCWDGNTAGANLTPTY